MDFAHSLLLIHAIVVLFVLGEIWFAQVVVYPLFAKVGETEYRDFHRFYSSRIPLPVIAPGFASFILPWGLVFWRPDAVPAWMALSNAICALVGLLVTVGLEIPRHNRLENGGKQDVVIRELIAYNWPRTLSITASASLTLVMLQATFKPV
jgi:hypothetical protein